MPVVRARVSEVMADVAASFGAVWDTSKPIRPVVDDRVYQVAHGGAINDGTDAACALKRTLEADGASLDFRNYGSVIKFKLT